jgi:hypothetical protein
MSEKIAKLMRRKLKKMANAFELEIANEFKVYVNTLRLRDKFKLCVRILKGKL